MKQNKKSQTDLMREGGRVRLTLPSQKKRLPKRENLQAPGEDRTRDLSLTKRTHYHYATEALAAKFWEHNLHNQIFL